MKTRFLITQSAVPIPVIEGAYGWFCTGETQIPEEEDAKTVGVLSSYFGALPSFLVETDRAEFAVESPMDDWLKFQNLVRQWRQERGAMSSITEMSICPAYQSIIGMGEKAVSFIMAELELEGDEPDQWFWALGALTGENPVREEDRGNFPKMAQSWLEWAKNERYAR